MVAGAINTINRACARKNVIPELSLVFRFSSDDPKFRSATRHTCHSFPDLPVYPAPISSRRGPGIHWLGYLFKVGIVSGFRLALPGLSRHAAVKAIREADIVIFKGGNFYRSWSRNPVTDFLAMILLFYPVLLAMRMGKRYALVSHTFGPFHTRSARSFVRWLIRRTPMVTAREFISRDVLKSCGVPSAKIAVSPDFGFGAYAADSAHTRQLLVHWDLSPRRYVAFTTRPWFYEERRRGDHRRYNAYIENAAEILDHAIEAGYVEQVALVVQNDGAHSINEPDMPVLLDIRAHMRQAQSTVLLDQDYTFDELCGIYENAMVVIGTRLHSCIFSFVVGTPPIAIAYSHKAEGIMKMMGLGKQQLDIHDLSVVSAKELLARVIADREVLTAHIELRADELRADLENTVSRFLFPDDSQTAASRAVTD